MSKNLFHALKKEHWLFKVLSILISITALMPFSVEGSMIAPAVFRLQTNNVTSPDGLRIEKGSKEHEFVVGPISGDRFFYIGDNGGTDSMSLRDVSQRAHAPTTVKLTTASNDLKLCLYHYTKQRCGQSGVEGTRDFAGNSFSFGLSDQLINTEKVLIDALQGRITKDEANRRLSQAGLSDYSQYVELVRKTPPIEIEKYSILGDIDGKRVIIEGAILYDPNAAAISPEEVKTDRLYPITFSAALIAAGLMALVVIIIYRNMIKRKK